MIPRTLDELLQSVAGKMQAWIGNNPLNNPVSNRSNPLVKLVTAVMQGQYELEKRTESFSYSARVDMLSGDALDTAAGRRCITRKRCVTTKYLITVFGDDCAVMPAGSVLYDSQGREWNVVEDINLKTNGSIFASGTGIAESSECGCWLLNNGDLFIERDNFIGITSATNVFLLEKGGEEESDEALRNRILNTGPLATIKGTVDHAVAALMAVDGVNFVRTYHGDLCDESGFMFVVHGGNCIDICEAIRLNGGSSTALLGNTICRTDCFDNIKFQQPCPVKLNIELTLNCDCPVITQEQAEMMVRSIAARVARLSRVSSSLFSKLHPDIESARLSVVCFNEIVIDPVTGDQSYAPYIDPITDEEKTIETDSFCDTNCRVIGPTNTIKLNPWEFPVIGDVTFAECVGASGVNCD